MPQLRMTHSLPYLQNEKNMMDHPLSQRGGAVKLSGAPVTVRTQVKPRERDQTDTPVLVIGNCLLCTI